MMVMSKNTYFASIV